MELALILFLLLLKMVTNSLLCYFTALLLMCQSVLSVELTFDLPDSARDCFHEHIKKNTSVVLEYQVKNSIKYNENLLIFKLRSRCSRNYVNSIG